MEYTPSASCFIKPFLLIGMGILGGCADTPGFRDIQFKGATSAPATPSIVQAYQDMVGEMWSDTVEIASMDRTLHGVRPSIDPIPPQNPTTQTVSFDRYQSLYFKVYKVEVVDQYKMPVSLNYDEHLLVMPNDAVHEWANRLRPTGGVNKLQVVITDARMEPTLAGGAQKRYDGRLSIEMRICTRDGTVLSSVKSSSVQSATVSEENRKAALNDMLLRLIDSTNGELERKISRQFSSYIDRKAV